MLPGDPRAPPNLLYSALEGDFKGHIDVMLIFRWILGYSNEILRIAFLLLFWNHVIQTRKPLYYVRSWKVPFFSYFCLKTIIFWKEKMNQH